MNVHLLLGWVQIPWRENKNDEKFHSIIVGLRIYYILRGSISVFCITHCMLLLLNFHYKVKNLRYPQPHEV